MCAQPGQDEGAAPEPTSVEEYLSQVSPLPTHCEKRKENRLEHCLLVKKQKKA